MKQRLLIFLIELSLVSFACQLSFGQDQASQRPVIHKMWVKSVDKSFTAKGYLHTIGDSTIVLTDRSGTKRQSIRVDQIRRVTFRPRHALTKGIGYGTALGFGIGGLIGGTSGSDNDNCLVCFSAGETAIILGTILGVPSAILGGILQSKKEKFIFSGDQATYENKKWLLKPYLLNKEKD